MMLTRAQRSNRKKLCVMAALVLLAAAAYMTVDVNFGNAKLLAWVNPKFCVNSK